MRSTLAKRIAILAVGVVLAATMLVLGLWQMQVFEDQGSRDARTRAAQAPVELLPLIPADGDVGDVYGRSVHVAGTYLPDEQLVVINADGTRRLLTALQLDDGRVLPVVRGIAPTGALPPPPAGRVDRVGVFLPAEASDARQVPAGDLPSVRLQLLAQRWPQRLTPGFATLRETDAAAEGLAAAPVALPAGAGSLRNGGYAIQWWVFAAFALGMAIVLARSVGRGERGPAGRLRSTRETRSEEDPTDG